MEFDLKFKELSKVVQVILLLLPIVNWVVEIFVRVSAVMRKKDELTVIGVVLAVILPFWGWIDLVWVLFNGELCLQ